MDNYHTFAWRLPSQVALAGSVLILASLPAIGVAQDRRPPRPDPQRFFDQLFGGGGGAADDRQEIDKVQIAVRDESKIGETASRTYLAELRGRGIKVVQQGEEIDYLRKLIDQVHPRMRNAARYRSIRVYLAESNEPDARSFPGGTLVFFRGLLDLAANEAALVGVIGHELSHLDHQHQLYDAKRLALMQRTFSGRNGFSPEDFFRSGSLLTRSFSRPFRPEDETLADDDGATWSYALGYDPREMAKLFLRMSERAGGLAAGPPVFLRTHPYHRDRYQAVLKRFEQLHAAHPDRPLYIGVKNLAERVPRSERAFRNP